MNLTKGDTVQIKMPGSALDGASAKFLRRLHAGGFAVELLQSAKVHKAGEVVHVGNGEIAEPSTRCFIHLAESWYGPACLQQRTDRLVDDLYLGTLATEDGESVIRGEVSLEWTDLRDKKPPSPRIGAFFDTLQSAANRTIMREAIDLLAPLGSDFQPREAVAVLLRAGWVDLTKRER